MFDRSLLRVLVLVIDTNGDDEDLDMGVGDGFFADLEKVINICSGIAV